MAQIFKNLIKNIYNNYNKRNIQKNIFKNLLNIKLILNMIKTTYNNKHPIMAHTKRYYMPITLRYVIMKKIYYFTQQIF